MARPRAFLGVLYMMCACAGRTLQHTDGVRAIEAVRILGAHYPQYRWDAATASRGDLDADTLTDVAVVGRGDHSAGVVGIVSGAVPHTRTWLVRVERPRDDGLCGNPDIKLSFENVSLPTRHEECNELPPDQCDRMVQRASSLKAAGRSTAQQGVRASRHADCDAVHIWFDGDALQAWSR